MSNKKKVTLLVAVYNGENFIESFYQTVSENTYPIKVLIVDDKSKDESYPLLKEKFKGYKDFKILKNENEKGFANALNFGISKIDTQYTVRLDIDDTMSKDRIQILMKELLSKDLDLCGSGYYLINEDDKILKKGIFPKNNRSIKSLFSKCYFGMGGAMILGKTEALQKLKFREKMIPSEEFDFFVRAISMNYKLGNVKKPLYNYLYHPNSLSNKTNVEKKFNYYKESLSEVKIEISEFRLEVIKKYYINKNLGKSDIINKILFFILRYVPKKFIK